MHLVAELGRESQVRVHPIPELARRLSGKKQKKKNTMHVEKPGLDK